MKKLLLSIGLVALSLSAFGQADITPIITGGTNSIAIASTNTYAADISAPKSANVGIIIQFKCTGTNLDTIPFIFKPTDSQGNVSTLSSQWLTISTTANGTNVVNHVTNMVFNGIATYRLTSGANINTNGAVTNLVITAITKTGI